MVVVDGGRVGDQEICGVPLSQGRFQGDAKGGPDLTRSDAQDTVPPGSGTVDR